MMLNKAVEHRRTSVAARPIRRGRHALATLIVFGGVACGPSDQGGTGPQVPGSISVATETSGFQQDDSYELLVDGASSGTIGANDELMVSELDPATYELDLGDVADNCTVEDAATATVVSAETASATLSIVCAPGEPSQHSLRANRDRLDLDGGAIVECSFGLCPSDDEWDFFVEFVSQSDPQATIRGNQTTAAELAHLPGKTLAELTEADVESASFTTEPIDQSFESGRVILVRTDAGNVYGLANPVENTILLTLAFDAVLLVAAP